MSNREWVFMADGAVGQTLSDMADDTPIFQAAAAAHNQRVLYPVPLTFIELAPPVRRPLWKWIFG